VVALIAVTLTLVTGNPVFDAAGSIVVGALLVLVALLLVVEIKGLITGQSADPEVEGEIRAFILARPEVAEVFHLITLHMGSEVMVAVKARMRETQDAARLVEDVNRVEAEVRRAFPDVEWLFFEPDNKA
jgi:divalent metal cation (Fe/Co/Zn/Cd) transporter